jgi:uncharacterized protein (TIGR04141 family)
MSKTRINVFLIKSSAQQFVEALDPEKHTDSHPLDQSVGLDGMLYLGRQRTSTPSWITLVNTILVQPVHAVTAGISGLLMLRAANRIFAVTFGQGRTFLRPSAIVRGFGLRATINRMHPEKLRSVDSRVYEEMVVASRKQTSRSSNMGSFGVDVARDLVRAVAGETQDQTYFTHLAGADAVLATTELRPNAYDEICEELLRAFEDTAYRANFGWVDYIQQERDPTIVEELNRDLVCCLILTRFRAFISLRPRCWSGTFHSSSSSLAAAQFAIQN